MTNEERQKNIELWENEVQEALKENDIWKAVGCRILANKLREESGEIDENVLQNKKTR